MTNEEEIGKTQEDEYQEIFGVKKVTFDVMLEMILKSVTAVRYVVALSKRNASFLGRFTWEALLDFEGLARILTVLACGSCFITRTAVRQTIPGEILKRPDSGFGICRYRVRKEYRI